MSRKEIEENLERDHAQVFEGKLDLRDRLKI